MLRVDQALSALRSAIPRLAAEEIALGDGLGRVMSESVLSTLDLPARAVSGMDGYAVRAADTVGAGPAAPRVLTVSGEVRAGHRPEVRLDRGQAVRIMTGAVLPEGADAVVMVEQTRERDANAVEILAAGHPGQNVRPAGENIRAGEEVVCAGQVLGPAQLGLLAAVGQARLGVTRRPRVAVLATGDELIPPGEPLCEGKIYSANSVSLPAALQRCGAIPVDLGLARDDPQALAERLSPGPAWDMLLVTGGISVGAYDFVRSSLVRLGVREVFWRVAMRPGRPVFFGQWGQVPVFGLPGNPVSALVAFEVFVRPAIRQLLGQSGPEPLTVNATLTESLTKEPGLRYFVRALTHYDGCGYVTRSTGPQGSGILRSLLLANSLIDLPESAAGAAAGTQVRVRILDPALVNSVGVEGGAADGP